MAAEEITKDSEYKGTRVQMDARMDNVRLRIHIDFSVGDVIVPGLRIIEYPVIPGGDTIELLAYPVETSIAKKKLQAMVALGDANSRMKDFYDVWVCSRHIEFNTDTLVRTIQATFKNRETALPDDEFEVLTTEFAARHLAQWNAFVKPIGEGGLVGQFAIIVENLAKFAVPLLHSAKE